MSSPNLTSGSPSKRRFAALVPLGNALIVAFATCHAFKILTGILPERNRLAPLPAGLTQAYEFVTGSAQDWDMFGTIPSFHDYGAQIVITEANGHERRLGALLPDFQDYPRPEQVRLFNLFDRMVGGAVGLGLRDAYLKQVDRTLHKEQRIKAGESWCLEVTEDYTRHLVHVSKDRRLFERRVRRFALTAPEGTSKP